MVPPETVGHVQALNRQYRRADYLIELAPPGSGRVVFHEDERRRNLRPVAQVVLDQFEKARRIIGKAHRWPRNLELARGAVGFQYALRTARRMVLYPRAVAEADADHAKRMPGVGIDAEYFLMRPIVNER